MDRRKVKDLLKKAEAIKKIMAKERDKLRDIHSELEDLLGSFDGIENIENGLRDIESGVDEISQYV